LEVGRHERVVHGQDATLGLDQLRHTTDVSHLCVHAT
jgi:hypothetical protein